MNKYLFILTFRTSFIDQLILKSLFFDQLIFFKKNEYFQGSFYLSFFMRFNVLLYYEYIILKIINTEIGVTTLENLECAEMLVS